MQIRKSISSRNSCPDSFIRTLDSCDIIRSMSESAFSIVGLRPNYLIQIRILPQNLFVSTSNYFLCNSACYIYVIIHLYLSSVF
jgi:hypothetical protein